MGYGCNKQILASNIRLFVTILLQYKLCATTACKEEAYKLTLHTKFLAVFVAYNFQNKIDYP